MAFGQLFNKLLNGLHSEMLWLCTSFTIIYLFNASSDLHFCSGCMYIFLSFNLCHLEFVLRSFYCKEDVKCSSRRTAKPHPCPDSLEEGAVEAICKTA